MTELLWRLVGKNPSKKQFGKRLEALSDGDLKLLAQQYLNVRYALMQAIWEHKQDAGASENMLEDLADWLILRGSAALEATLRGKASLPPRDAWDDLEGESLFPLVFGAIKGRFGEIIYFVTGHEYPYPWTTASEFKHVDYLAASAKN